MEIYQLILFLTHLFSLNKTFILLWIILDVCKSTQHLFLLKTRDRIYDRKLKTEQIVENHFSLENFTYTSKKEKKKEYNNCFFVANTIAYMERRKCEELCAIVIIETRI